jgi:hypothetical protein
LKYIKLLSQHESAGLFSAPPSLRYDERFEFGKVLAKHCNGIFVHQTWTVGFGEVPRRGFFKNYPII